MGGGSGGDERQAQDSTPTSEPTRGPASGPPTGSTPDPPGIPSGVHEGPVDEPRAPDGTESASPDKRRQKAKEKKRRQKERRKAEARQRVEEDKAEREDDELSASGATTAPKRKQPSSAERLPLSPRSTLRSLADTADSWATWYGPNAEQYLAIADELQLMLAEMDGEDDVVEEEKRRAWCDSDDEMGRDRLLWQ